jgi:flagellum-specific ATP synthase
MVHANNNNFEQRLAAIKRTLSPEINGYIAGLTGLTVAVSDFAVPVGAQCEIITRNGSVIPAQAIGFRSQVSVLMPLAEMVGIARGDRVRCRQTQAAVPVGEQLLGRVINADAEPIDGRGPLLCQMRHPVDVRPLQALERVRIDASIGTGIRTIDALTSCGRGQRLGIFSGPGVGKSILLGMIARNTSADVNVIALVGERGREVREFIEKDLGPEGLQRSVVVVSTSDEPAPLRTRAGFVATTIAEYFRDLGKDVLLLMDSVTRIAIAQRQIGLAMGEPPATKGFTPSVFALLPQLIERCGRTKKGSITGFYTVLVEGDDLAEPISDAMRSILDGHLWLSRDLANRGHYPAIDVLESISRVMPDVTDENHILMARDITRLVALYRDVEDLVNIGAYAPGTSAEIDLAVQAQPKINQFLQQTINEKVTFKQACEELRELIEDIRPKPAFNQPTPKNNQAQKPPSPTPSLEMERMRVGL